MNIEDSIIQLEEVFEGTPWYGPSVLKSLKTIPAKLWDGKPENVSHSIAELVYHILDWREFVVQKLKGNEAFSIQMNSEKDWRKNVSIATEAQKTIIIDELTQTQDILLELLETRSDSWMSEFVLGKDYTNEYMIRGLVQHDIYHLGQINMIYSQLK